MKKKIIWLSLIFITILLISNKVFASDDVTKKLYQDITINVDGSITIKEAAVLSGEYNGRSREIRFKNTSAVKFTGIYSNFAGNTDIYDGTDIKNIKIYDISQENFNSIDDIDKIEKEYKEVESASNGKYGVYTVEDYSYESDFKIYCPSNKNKVFCMEYTIKDAVVIHNDVAELYWNVIGNNYRERISDFQVRVHLPGEDNDLRVWTHGPLTGSNKILDNKTVIFTDSDVKAYKAETIRIMFNKNLVPDGNKTSGVNGREYILKYEQEMANSANYERAQEEYNKINKANQAVLDLEESPSMYRYNWALEYVEKIKDKTTKNELLKRIDAQKTNVNKIWKEEIDSTIERLRRYNYKYLNESNFKYLEEDINEGFDEKAKEEYKKVISEFTEVINKKNARLRKVCLIIVVLLYGIASILIIYKLIKLRLEKKSFKGKYFRDFPSQDEPYVLEYLMKRKTTNLSISATILSLVTKKVIQIEEITNKKNNIKFTLLENKNFSPRSAESRILELLFKIVGNNNTCYLEDLKNYGKSESRAERLTNKIKEFKADIKKEINNRGYFNSNASNILFNILLGLLYFFSLCMSFGVLKGIEDGWGALKYFATITLVTVIYYIIINKDKNRTQKGKIEYSKWLAHKRFLEHFSMLKERDLPEIELWEKYLVTATVLGCADKVQDKMKIYINEYPSTDYNSLLLVTSINNNIIRTINTSVSSSISRANSTIASSNSSSGGGFGGGSSGGGGAGGRRRRRWTFLKHKNQDI